MAAAEVKKQGRKVQITVPNVYRKVDEGVWAELEKYLFSGFLTSSSLVQGRTFVFKSLNAHEVALIEYMRPHGVTGPEARSVFRGAFIAHSVFMADGQNVLHDRPRHIARLIKAVGRIPPKVQDRVVENLTSLNRKASRLFPLAESYSYESRSRYRWLQMKGGPVHSSLYTGIPGTDELGMNYCQQVWTAMNNIQDMRDALERDWANAKFVGSCFAGKGIRSIDEKDKSRQEKDRVDREEEKMKVLHAYLNRISGAVDPAETVMLPDGRQAEVSERFRADSVEELAEQLSASLSGEKDFHDSVIEAKERMLRARAEAIEEGKRMLFTRAREMNEPAPGGGSRVIGGKADADAYLRRMELLRQEQIERSRRAMVPGQEHEASDEGGEGGT